VTVHPLAHEALAWIWELYDIEDWLATVDPKERQAVRMRESVPMRLTTMKLKDRLVRR